MSENKKPGDQSAAFTLDNDEATGSTMPSVTRLLDRKKLVITESSTSQEAKQKQPVSSPPPVTETPPAPAVVSLPKFNYAPTQLPVAPVAPAAAATPTAPKAPVAAKPVAKKQSAREITLSTDDGSMQIEGRSELLHQCAPTIETRKPNSTQAKDDSQTMVLREPPAAAKPQPVARRAERRVIASKLLLWHPKLLKEGKDPLGKGIVAMLDRGASSALFLAITAPPANCPVPHFVGTAAVMPQEKLAIWTGVKWDPTVAPEIWNQFIKNGYVELSPPGTLTNMKSNRNIGRAAFGIRKDEWLLLVRVGPANSCRGLLAIVSRKSLLADFAVVLPFFAAAVPNAAAA